MPKRIYTLKELQIGYNFAMKLWISRGDKQYADMADRIKKEMDKLKETA